jgi:hypothetical protein
VLETAELSVLAVATQMPVRHISQVLVALVKRWKSIIMFHVLWNDNLPMITHFLADFLHACFERSCSGGIFRWQWLIKPLSCLVVICVLFFSVFLSSGRSRCDGDATIFRSTGLTHSGWTSLVSNAYIRINIGVICYSPHEESPFDSLGAAADTGVTLGDRDVTEALGVNVGDVLLLFVTVRESCCTTGGAGGCTAN